MTVFVFHFWQIKGSDKCIASNPLDLSDSLIDKIHTWKNYLIVPSPNVIFVDKQTVSKPWQIIVYGLVLIEGIFSDN